MDKIRVGLMGFGRIGRNVFRILKDHPSIEIVAISDIMPFESMAYLLRWDTVHGPLADSVELGNDHMFVGGRKITLFNHAEPKDVPWDSAHVDLVVDATNRYLDQDSLSGHLKNGVKHVILTSSPKDGEDIPIVVRGINDAALDAKPKIVSISSVTINCIAPLLQILDDAFGITAASMTTVHAYTNSQRLADVPTEDYRSSRSAAENIIPAPTSAPAMIGKILPKLDGKLQGIAMNVPIPDGSIVDLVAEIQQETSVEEINALLASAAGSDKYRSIIEFASDAIVSSDIIGNPHSLIFDSRATSVLSGNLIKTLAWFDNGWGFASRSVEIMEELTGVGGAA